jgi:hypothetical protein
VVVSLTTANGANKESAWERGDFSSVDWADPEIAYGYVGGPEPSSGRGIAGLGAAWRHWLRGWDGWHVEATEYRELDHEHVLAADNNFATGKASGMEMQSTAANLFQIRDRKVTRFVHYWDRDRALVDLGLAE